MASTTDTAIESLKALTTLVSAAKNTRAQTGRLASAAALIADEIAIAAEDAQVKNLARGYRRGFARSNVGTHWGLIAPDGRWIEGDGSGGDKYVHGDFNCEIAQANRKTLMQFAKDVSEGLLSEIAADISKLEEETTKAANLLEQP